MNTKEEVIKKLKGYPYNVKCPKCKCEEFLKTTTEKVKIIIEEHQISDDYLEFVDDYGYKCFNCGRKLKEKEME